MKEIHFATIDSTNTYAKLHAAEWTEMTCISADEQTAGRGRFERKWVSPKGNLYVTFCFSFRDVMCLGLLMGVSLTKVLLNNGFDPKIKWPNDIQLSGKKVAGILCETNGATVFLGVGLNVNMEDMSNIDQAATSLLLETGKTWDRQQLLKELQKQFVEDLEFFKKEGFKALQSFFNDYLAYKGELIRWFDGKKEWEGVCLGVESSGRLQLIVNGELKNIFSGEMNINNL